MARPHYRKQFDHTARLVFTRRRRLGIPGAEVVEPGDEVTDTIRAALGSGRKLEHRLRVWFEAGHIDIVEWESPRTRRQQGTAEPVPLTEAPAGPEHVGGPWYRVHNRDGSTRKVRGKDAAQEAYRAVWGD